MERALSLFGEPHRTFPSLHVAGTNGKGSTAAMLHRILSLAGYRTGLYTSPHLVSFTERVRIGDQEISPIEVVELAQEVLDGAATADVPLTFFEFVTVMAFVYFSRRRIDVAVVEVGLGGRLDATNLIRPLVSLITSISRDHEAYLGSDLLSIAREKGGIIKPGIPLVCGQMDPNVTQLLENIAKSQGSRAFFLGRDFEFMLKPGGLFDYKSERCCYRSLSVALRGRHQRANSAVALRTLEAVADGFALSEAALRQGLATVKWPGRFEIMSERPAIILDGAHNGEGVKALVEEIESYREGRNVKLLFAAMEDKDSRLMLRMLEAVAEEVVLTRVRMERCADPHRLAHHLSAGVSHRVIEDPELAVQALLESARPDDIVLVAGSLYLLGEVRPWLEEFARKISPIPLTQPSSA
jgi:dihydrofolate synthase/folylpolyglutamate synthase